MLMKIAHIFYPHVVKVDKEAIAYGGGDTHHPRSHDGALDR